MIPLVNIQLFKPGCEVIYQDKKHIVEYVQICRHDVLLKLKDVTQIVNSIFVQCEPTVVDFNRE